MKNEIKRYVDRVYMFAQAGHVTPQEFSAYCLGYLSGVDDLAADPLPYEDHSEMIEYIKSRLETLV